MLNRLIGATVAVTLVAACGSAPPPAEARPAMPPAAQPPADATVTAVWQADDGSVVAVNLVVPPGATGDGTREIAARQHSAHPRARVIVRVFESTAGSERYVVGHVPAGVEPLVKASGPPSLIAIYDFRPGQQEPGALALPFDAGYVPESGRWRRPLRGAVSPGNDDGPGGPR